MVKPTLSNIEIRWHGRGGQGVWTASNILAEAAIREGKHAQSFPTFGPERMGAPIMAFTRISDEAIEVHSGIYEPDTVIVLDPTLLGAIDVLEGLKKDGLLVLNYKSSDVKELSQLVGADLRDYKTYVVSATEIAIKTLGRGITNTAMLGALVKAVPLVKLETIFEVVKERFRGPIAEKNIEVIKEAYEETKEVTKK